MKDVYINDNKFYNNIRLYKYSKKKFHYLYKGNDIIDDDFIKNNNCNENLKWKIYTIHALNIKDVKKRYSYIYDVVCDYLDNEFNEKNICHFEDNICDGIKNKKRYDIKTCGCCYGKNRGICKNLDGDHCTIKSISCKLFTCRYLKKQNVKFKINDIPLLKYFFNIRQKFILDTYIFTDKNETIRALIKTK